MVRALLPGPVRRDGDRRQERLFVPEVSVRRRLGDPDPARGLPQRQTIRTVAFELGAGRFDQKPLVGMIQTNLLPFHGPWTTSLIALWIMGSILPDSSASSGGRQWVSILVAIDSLLPARSHRMSHPRI